MGDKSGNDLVEALDAELRAEEAEDNALEGDAQEVYEENADGEMIAVKQKTEKTPNLTLQEFLFGVARRQKASVLSDPDRHQIPQQEGAKFD